MQRQIQIVSVYMSNKVLNFNSMKRFFTLFVITLFASSMLAQSFNFNQGSIKQKKYLEKILFQNINGKLIVPVTINGKTYNFVIDTGAPLTISDKLYKELNLPIISQKEITDVSGRKKEVKIISLPELHLQEITFIDTPGCVFHEESSDFFNLFECLEIDGIIGSNMLRNSVIQFDERSKHIIISNNFFKIPKKKVVKAQKMKLSPSSNPFIMIGLHKERKVGDYVLFDTGASEFYCMSMYTYNYLNGRADVTKIAEGEGSFAWGFNGVFENQQHLLLNIKEFYLRNKIFNDLIVTTTNTISLIGAQLLQYGKTTLDYKKKFFYFDPFDNVNTDELSERPRAILPTLQNEKLVVGIIWDKTLESKINLGDEVLSINGFDIQAMDTCEYLTSDFTSSNEVLILELRDINTGEIKKVEIKRM